MKEFAYFRLIGRTTRLRVVRKYSAAGFLPAVVGHTIDGKFQTAARIADIIPLTGFSPEGTAALHKQAGR